MQSAKVTAVALLALFGAADLASAGSAGRCGGTGGNHTKTLTCPDGQYIAGVAARGGAFVDEFSIACRKHPVSGAQGELGSFKSAGPGGGTSGKSGKCGNNHAVYVIRMNSGALVDKVHNGGCTPRDGNGWAQAGTPSAARVDIGGPGGVSCQITCPIGEAMYKVTVKYGGVIDSIRGECRK